MTSSQVMDRVDSSMSEACPWQQTDRQTDRQTDTAHYIYNCGTLWS